MKLEKLNHISSVSINKSIPCIANALLQLLLENSKSKKGHNYVKKTLRVACPTDVGSPFDGKQLIGVSSKYLQ